MMGGASFVWEEIENPRSPAGDDLTGTCLLHGIELGLRLCSLEASALPLTLQV